MKKYLPLLLLVICLLPGCTSKLMTPVQTYEAPVVASPEDAIIVFMRPSFLGSAVQASVFDASTNENKLVGIVSNKTKVAYATAPGKKLFMVVSEAADFMQADLEAGKTYYALVTPRFGVWKARFSLKPITAEQLLTPQFTEWDAKCSFVKNTPASIQWAQDNGADIEEKRMEYYNEWIMKPAHEMPKLNARDGKVVELNK